MTTYSIYRNTNFLKLIIGNTISTFGDNLYSIALTVALYQTSGSISAVAFMWLVRAMIRIPIQIVSGVLADKFPRKLLVCMTNLVSIPFALGFLAVAKDNWLIIYSLIFFLQALNDIEQPAIIGLTQELVEKDKLKEANATATLFSEIATFCSPAIAGIIMYYWGVPILFFLNGVSFLAAFMVLIFIRDSSPAKIEAKRRESMIVLAKQGFYKAWKDKALLLILAIGVLPGMMGRFFEIYKVYIADEILKVGPEGIVIFSYSMAIGGLLSPIIVKYFLKKQKFTAKFYSLQVLSLSIILSIWAIIPNAVLSFLLLTVCAILFSVLGIIFNTYLQETVEKEYIGRIFSFYRVIMILGAIIGIVLAPKLLEWFGAAFGFFLCAILAVISLAIQKSKLHVPEKE